MDRCLYVDLASEVVRAGEDAEWLLPTRASRQTTISRSVKPAIRDLSNRLCAAAQSHVSATVKFQGGKLVVQAGSRPGMALEALEMCKEGAGKARLDALLGDFWEWLNPVLCNTHIPDLSSDGLSLSPNVGTSTRTAKEILGGLGGAIEQLMSCLALPARLSAPAGAWLRGRLGSAAALVLIAGAPVESGEFAQFRDEAAGAARSLDARFEALSLGEGGGGVEEAVLGKRASLNADLPPTHTPHLTVSTRDCFYGSSSPPLQAPSDPSAPQGSRRCGSRAASRATSSRRGRGLCVQLRMWPSCWRAWGR